MIQKRTAIEAALTMYGFVVVENNEKLVLSAAVRSIMKFAIDTNLTMVNLKIYVLRLYCFFYELSSLAASKRSSSQLTRRRSQRNLILYINIMNE